MFDKNGNTGGCQATYTVTQSLTDAEPTCANVTLPPQLEVEGIVNNGPISRFGWVEQCSDIQLTPIGGTPPYTMTIAPALHPPYNIMGDGAMNWTVQLTWASPFFISVADSAGSMWANGQLHAAGPGTNDCLIGNRTEETLVKPVVAIGSGIGGLVVGVALGLLTMFFVMRARRRAGRENGTLGYSVPSAPMAATTHHTQQYHVEPFRLPTEDGRLSTPGAPSGGGVVHPPIHASPSTGSLPSAQPVQNKGAVYVLHHDSNTAPVTIYHEQGQEIVELPPLYPTEGTSPSNTSPSQGDGRSDGALSDSGRTASSVPPTFLQQQRRPNHPRKASRSTGAPSGPR